MDEATAGRVAIVTGASSGIGRAAALRLAAQGYRLVIAARSEARLEALAGELATQSHVHVGDLTAPGEVERMVAAAKARFGRIDVLFANAGLYIAGDASEGDPEAWDRLLAVNVNSVFRVVRAVLPHMIEQRAGDIVVTSSVSGHQAIPWEPVYSASKHAIQAFVHGVRRQVARYGVRVAALAPGMVLNELWGLSEPAEIEARVAAHQGLRNEDVVDALMFMLTRPPHVAVRDLVILPQMQDL